MTETDEATDPTRMRRRMVEATRLTRGGRLSEATALIQRTLGSGGRGPVPPSGTPQWVDSAVVRTARGAPDQDAGTTVRTPPPTTDGAPRGGRFVSESWTSAAGTRAYKIYVPGSAVDVARPLLVMLHGCTQSADDFAAGTRMNVLAERRGIVVVYPEQSRQANPSGCWNWFKPGDQRRDRGEPAIIADIVRRVVSVHHIDRRRIAVAGMSAGGAMSVVMGITHPDLFAAVGVHSGIAYGVADDLASAYRTMRDGGVAPPRAGRGVPTIVFHGDRDQTVHRRNAEHVLRQSIAGVAEPVLTVHEGGVVDGHAHTRYVYRDSRRRVHAEGWSVHGLGHAWSGGDPAASYTDAAGPDASAEMLRFFAAHGRVAHPVERPPM